MYAVLFDKVEIVGWKKPGVEQSNTHYSTSMDEFMDSHVNHHSTRNNTPVAPFFFSINKPSGPDMVFFIRIDGGACLCADMKLHQSSAKLYKKGWDEALVTISASYIRDHAKDFWNFYPDNIYINMVVAYPMKCSSSLPPPRWTRATSSKS